MELLGNNDELIKVDGIVFRKLDQFKYLEINIKR